MNKLDFLKLENYNVVLRYKRDCKSINNINDDFQKYNVKFFFVMSLINI